MMTRVRNEVLLYDAHRDMLGRRVPFCEIAQAIGITPSRSAPLGLPVIVGRVPKLRPGTYD
jgi:hypothetical protein